MSFLSSSMSIRAFRSIALLSFLVLSWGALNAETTSQSQTDAMRKRHAANLSRLPLAFERVEGHTFAARASGGLVALSAKGISVEVSSATGTAQPEASSGVGSFLNAAKLNGGWNPLKALERGLGKQIHSEVLEIRLDGGNESARAVALEQKSAAVNYFLGNQPSEWRRNSPLYGKIRYQNVYPSIDVSYYGNPQDLELDFEVKPSGRPEDIRIKLPADIHAEITPAGELRVQPKGGASAIVLHAPVTYQTIRSRRVLVASSYRKLGANTFGFRVAEYDRSRTLIIDPIIVFSTFLGGGNLDMIQAIAVDNAGNLYVAGVTLSTNFPVATPIFATKKGTSADAFVSKLSPSGENLIYSTYLGGTAFDQILGLSVDSAGVVTVAGDTASADFPLQNPIQPAFGGGGADLWVARINAAGSALTYSTYLGGSGFDLGLSADDALPLLTVDAAGAAHITGATTSNDFPTVTPIQAAFAGQIDGIVAKLNPAGSTLVFSTYLGGSAIDFGIAITTDVGGSIYLTGATNSTNFPTQAAFDSTSGGGTCGTAACPDAFISKLNPTGTALVYSTYLGGAGEEEGHGIAVDNASNVYVAGYTVSADFPTVNPVQFAKGAGDDVFVSKLNPAGSALVYSSFIGGGGSDTAMQVRVDAAGRAVVTGYTGSNAFPIAGATQASRAGAFDAFLSVMNAAGSGFDFSTYAGGLNSESGIDLAVTGTGAIYMAGWTESANFPVANAYQATFGGGTCGTAPNTFPCDDGFVVRYGAIGTAPSITSISPSSATVGGPAFTLTVNGAGFNSTSLVRVGVLSRPTTFVNSGQLTAAMPASDLAAPGNLQISVFNGAPDNLASNSVTFTVSAAGNAPAVAQGGVVNNASFAPSPAPLAPGSIAAVFGQRLTDGSTALSSSFDSNGRLLTTLAGARVTVNGIAAPLFYATPGQLGVQIPVEVAGQTSASLQVGVGSLLSTPVNVAIAPTAPGIFTVTQDGRGAGAITHADGSVVTAGNPARPGEVVIVYVTGLGALTPAVATGSRAGASRTLSPALVSFNGVAGTVEYAGSAPGFVGLNQINVRVPEGTLPSNSVQVVVFIGGRESNTATIAVQ